MPSFDRSSNCLKCVFKSSIYNVYNLQSMINTTYSATEQLPIRRTQFTLWFTIWKHNLQYEKISIFIVVIKFMKKKLKVYKIYFKQFIVEKPKYFKRISWSSAINGKNTLFDKMLILGKYHWYVLLLKSLLIRSINYRIQETNDVTNIIFWNRILVANVSVNMQNWRR